MAGLLRKKYCVSFYYGVFSIDTHSLILEFLGYGLNEKGSALKLIHYIRKSLNKEKIEVLILTVVILASGFYYLVLNLGLLGVN